MLQKIVLATTKMRNYEIQQKGTKLLSGIVYYIEILLNFEKFCKIL
jgi:hypothetical protein